jgi:hypothetical protein
MKEAFGAYKEMAVLDDEHLRSYLRTRRPGTLQIHASAWRLYLKYCEEEGIKADQLDEAAAYCYLQALNVRKAPPTRAPSFLKACNFAFGVLKFHKGNGIANSARCRGSAAASQSRRKDRRQRDPLTMEQVKALEVEVSLARSGGGALTKAEAVVAGFFLFCIHTRTRCSDAAKVKLEPTIDDAQDGDPTCSFVEASTTGDCVKTGNTEEKASLKMPLAGLSKGLSNLPWAEAWLSIRDELSMEATDDECLMLEPLMGGEFGQGRIEAGQATEMLRHLLTRLGFAPETLANVGSHSCKATLLSVCAKAGMQRDLRRTLGGHAVPGDRSVDVYSRDVLAFPLLELGRLLEKIRTGEFAPDSSRSGRWRKVPTVVPNRREDKCKACDKPLENDAIFECPCSNLVHDSGFCVVVCAGCGEKMCELCCAVGAHTCELSDESSDSSGSSSEDDSDGEKVTMALEEEEREEAVAESAKALLVKGVENGSQAIFPEGGVLINKITGVVHMMKDAHTCACGLNAIETRYEYHYEASAIYDKKLCWRPGCAKWEKDDSP